jgi:hypothetical protein
VVPAVVTRSMLDWPAPPCIMVGLLTGVEWARPLARFPAWRQPARPKRPARMMEAKCVRCSLLISV